MLRNPIFFVIFQGGGGSGPPVPPPPLDPPCKRSVSNIDSGADGCQNDGTREFWLSSLHMAFSIITGMLKCRLE